MDAKRPFQLERLKQARQFHMLSKGELRIACAGLPVGSYENGKRRPSDYALKLLSKVLQFPPHFFTKPVKAGLPEEQALDTLALHHSFLRCPCGMDDCGYWAPAGEELEPCKYGRKPPSCEYCERPAMVLCDGKARYDRDDAETCDRPLCTHHRKRIGPHADVCPACAKKPQFA